MPRVRDPAHEGRTLQRLYEITQDILRAPDLDSALGSIGRGLQELYRFRYVSIVASETPGGEMYRRVILGFPADAVRERLGEHIPRNALMRLLMPEFEVVPHCYYIPAEREHIWAYNIYTGEGDLESMRSGAESWHDHDSLTLVLTDRSGEMLGYISVDGPLDGLVPTHETLREMQLFVNLVGLALAATRGHVAEIERREMTEENARAQNEFFSVVSHEVRSPLAAIRGATSLLETHFESMPEERRKELLHVLGTSTARLSAIFEDFLLLSRMDAGRLTLRFESVDPIAVVEESVGSAEFAHPEREFRTLYLAPLPAVTADEGRVVQVLSNLLNNAAKYATPESVIAIELKERGGDVWFGVRNEGPGIAPADRDRVFTRFGRIGAGNDSIGLGLYISRELVTLMGGAIGFESEPGKVTTFWFTLPCSKE